MKERSGPPLRKTTIAGVVGNILEWYDLAVFEGTTPLVSLVAYYLIPARAKGHTP